MFSFEDVRFKEILNMPSFSIEEGKITTLVGPSGSGKTTVLRLLNKMLSPTRGRILYKGQDLAQINSVAHRRRVLMLAQTPPMFAGSVKDNLLAGFRFQERPFPPDNELTGMLNRVMLYKELDSPALTLSGGEKQRLALGRVLLLEPDVYLLDEPSSALDDVTEDFIIKMVAEHVKKSGKTLIMVTHSREVADHYSDEIFTVSGGSISKGVSA